MRRFNPPGYVKQYIRHKGHIYHLVWSGNTVEAKNERMAELQQEGKTILPRKDKVRQLHCIYVQVIIPRKEEKFYL